MQELLEVWITLIPPSETLHPPLPAPNFTDCVHCPTSKPFLYGGGGFDGYPATGGGFCCPVQSIDHEHCPSAECCLAPIPGSVGCEGILRCDNNPHNHLACPPNQTAHWMLPVARRRRVPPTRQHHLSPVPEGEEYCSVPANSPLTSFNESAMMNTSKGWRGCDDYEGWGQIIGKLAKQYPMLRTLNIDDFSSNVPQVFTEPYIKAIKVGLSGGGVSLIPTFYYQVSRTKYNARKFSPMYCMIYFRGMPLRGRLKQPMVPCFTFETTRRAKPSAGSLLPQMVVYAHPQRKLLLAAEIPVSDMMAKSNSAEVLSPPSQPHAQCAACQGRVRSFR